MAKIFFFSIFSSAHNALFSKHFTFFFPELYGTALICLQSFGNPKWEPLGEGQLKANDGWLIPQKNCLDKFRLAVKIGF